MPDQMIFNDRIEEGTRTSAVTMQKWGGSAFFMMAVALIVAPMIYLVGNLRSAIGPFSYSLADFLYGPVWAASLITGVFALRESIGERASRRMDLAMLAAFVAAGAMVGVACIRSANRYYHLTHPDLNLEMSTTVLVVWATLVAGVLATGWHFTGWVLILIGSAGWTSHRLPRALSVLYLVTGVSSLFVYVLPVMEGSSAALSVILSIWQGILLWKAKPGDVQTSEINTDHPDQS